MINFVFSIFFNGKFCISTFNGAFLYLRNIGWFLLYLRKYWTVFFVLEKIFTGVFCTWKKIQRCFFVFEKISTVKNILQIFVEGIKLYWTYSDEGKNTVGKPFDGVVPHWRTWGRGDHSFTNGGLFYQPQTTFEMQPPKSTSLT